MPEYDPSADYYEILQVHSRARSAVIKAAYRAILRELRAHPDLGGGEDFARSLNEAYRVLSDSELRAAYDGARLLVAGGRNERVGIEQLLTCPSCRERNAVPLGTDIRAARCSSCGALLQGGAEPAREAPQENMFALPREEYQRLCRDSQLDCRAGQVEAGEGLQCRFCGNKWRAKQSGRPLRTCPICARLDWHAFRVLKCRVCGYEWRSSRLGGWAYRDHPRCPNCTSQRWSSYCESHPLRWLLGAVHR